MQIEDRMFGFIVTVKEFDLTMKRPVPPKGYIEFNSKRAHCQAGKCPNCGHEKPGTWHGHGGFQNRDVQNLMRALDRLERRIDKPSYELFSTHLDSENPMMLKCHISRFSVGEFMCCKAKIWHDFFSEDGKGWKYYYLSRCLELMAS
jgi:hypothetical protein